MIRVAVMGYGTIGSGVVEVLDINKNSIAKRAGEEIGVKYILDLRDFPGDPIQEKVVHDYKMIANDPEVQIVVETMGGVEPLVGGRHMFSRFKHCKACRRRGKTCDDLQQGARCGKGCGADCTRQGEKCQFHV